MRSISTTQLLCAKPYGQYHGKGSRRTQTEKIALSLPQFNDLQGEP